jgi:uncharacterized protein with GYD domain
MPAYITLYKWTQQGLANIKAAPDRIKQAKALIEKTGGRAIGVWVTMGEYDLVAISEGPDDAVAATTTLAIAQGGNVTSLTLKAFSEEEFAQIVAKLP